MSLTPKITEELLDRPGAHIVIVGASFGEFRLVDKLTKALRSERPGAKITWAIRDSQTADHVIKMHPDQSVVLWPYDWITPVVRWLRQTKPDVIVFVERWRFANLVIGSRRYGADLMLVNGRCKRRKFFFRFAKPYYRWLFGAFGSALFQNEEDMANAAEFLGRRTTSASTGDIKFDLSHIPIEPERAVRVEKWLANAGDTPILAAGSTVDKVEDQFVLDSFASVRKTHAAKLMIAPRRPERAADLEKLARDMGLTVSRRSKMQGDADVYLLDTLGELSYAYRFATAAYVGGSLNGMGHNVIEPLEWGIPVSYGMNRGNFAAIQEACERAGVGTRVGQVSQLAVHWLGVLNSPESREDIGQRCKSMVQQHRGALGVTLSELRRLLNQRESQGS